MRNDFRLHTIPDKAHPLVKLLFVEMNKQSVSIPVLSKKAGLGDETLVNWRVRYAPQVPNLEAAFNALGLTLKPVPMDPK